VPDSKMPIHRDPFAPGDDPRRHRGRKTGSRAKLAKRFFEDTYAAWEEQGESALARAAFHDPMGFVSMVARLMPQKIEVSTPTDGMTDERLAEMLEMAERMASLRAATVIEGTAGLPLLAHEPAYENGLSAVGTEEGGRGPDRVGPARGVNTSDAVTADPGRIAETPHNKLDVADSNSSAAERQVAEAPHNELDVADLPYPVGRPFPKDRASVERANRAKLEEDVDPASLF